MLFPHWGYGIFGVSPYFTLFHPFSHFFALLHHIPSSQEGALGARRASFWAISDPYFDGIPQKVAAIRGDVANLPMLLRKRCQLSNPRFVAWLFLGIRVPPCVARPS